MRRIRLSPTWWPSLSLTCLEAVDVDDHHRALAAVAGGEGDVLVEFGAEAAPVEQPGQRVVVGQVAQLGLGLLGLLQRPLDDLAVLGAQLLAAPPSTAGSRFWECARVRHPQKVLTSAAGGSRKPARFRQRTRISATRPRE